MSLTIQVKNALCSPQRRDAENVHRAHTTPGKSDVEMLSKRLIVLDATGFADRIDPEHCNHLREEHRHQGSRKREV